MTKKFVWKKLGLVFKPDPAKWWMRSHATLPTPVQLEGGIHRVYFSSRDERNRSHVGFFDIDLHSPHSILHVSDEPVLTPGPLGQFDDHGIYAASAVKHQGQVYLYTIGWNPGIRPPLFYSSIGLAISRDGGETFEKRGNTPIMARSDWDPCLVTSPFVLKDGDLWRMWYVSGYHWEEIDQVPTSFYHIKYAESEDGVEWKRDGTVAIDHVNRGEKNIARAWVLQEKGLYRAWFAYNREQNYRIGYAESTDGREFERKDDSVGISVSDEPWESDAVAHPAVVQTGNKYYMFYNGNRFGADGIALAEMLTV